MPEVSPARAAALSAISGWRGRGPGRGQGGRSGGRGGGVKAEDALEDALSSSRLERRDRALAHEIFYGSIRNLIRLDHVLSFFIKRKITEVDPELMDVLRIAAYQLLFLDRVPAHAAVNDAVEQAKKARGRGAASFVNGVLRSMLRRPSDVRYPDAASDPAGSLGVMHSFPRWLAGRWIDRFGPEEAGALMAASNAVPPLTLRANTLKTDRDALYGLMSDAGLEVQNARYAPDGIEVRSHLAVRELPGYSEGLFSVQDEAAQLVGILLGPGPGDAVLDACAAPGGKTAHISALSGGLARVLAADIGLDKSMRMKENIARLDARGVHIAVFDSSLALPVKGLFDRILLDAPCSALGIIRRRPEVKYSRREPDVERLARLQSAMLENVASSLRQGGVLVYSTCTTEPEEGESVVEGFLAGHPGFELEDAAKHLPAEAACMVAEKGYMRCFPHVHGTDGFFAARLVRKDRDDKH